MDKYILFADAKSPHTIKWLKELVNYFDIYLISLNGYSKEVLEYIKEDKLIILNKDVTEAGGNYSLIAKYFKLAKVVKRINPKYINAHYLSSYGFLASLVKIKYPNVKLVQSTWGTDILVTPFENFIKKVIAKFAISKANLITSDSYYMSDKIREIYQHKNIMTFPFGLDEFALDEEFKKDENLIFSNRALVKNYNIEQILKWFLKYKSTKLKLVIANDGNYRAKLEKFVKDNALESQVKFVGFLSKKEQEYYYKKATYYISIPSSDSTSVALLEAMRYGCYPIVSNIPANREWIVDALNGKFFSNSIELPKVEANILKLNQKLIYEKAIFSKSIKHYIEVMESL